MLGDAGADAGADIAGGAQLQRDAPVAHERRQTAELLPALRAGDVVDDPHPVAQALRPAELDGFPDARQAERLAGVDGGVEVLPLHIVERVQVAGGWVPGLGAGDVEADAPAVAPADGQLGDLQAAGRRPHGRADEVDCQVGAGRTALEPVDDGLHHLVQRQPLLRAQLRGHPHLGVDHAIGGEVHGALVRHPLDGIAVLHDADGVGERLQVEDEVVALGAAVEPGGQFVHVVGREVAVAVLVGQFDDGPRAQPAVEVVVQQHLRQGGDVHVHGRAAVRVRSWRACRAGAAACRRAAAASSSRGTRRRPRCSAPYTRGG